MPVPERGSAGEVDRLVPWLPLDVSRIVMEVGKLLGGWVKSSERLAER